MKKRSFLNSRILKVTDRIYSAVDYGRANVIYVVTNTSVVVIDSTESPMTARVCFEAFRKICRLPVAYLIYTHFHGDHTRGANVFCEAKTTIIAHELLPKELAKVEMLERYYQRATETQFDSRSLPRRLQKLKRAVFISLQQENGYVPPHILVNQDHRFTEGGVMFELYHAPGETVDQLILWLPHERALLPADLFYRGFPMLSSPMKPDRPVLSWAESLERMCRFRPKYLVPSHGAPIRGRAVIDSVLRNYAQAIRHVHNETVKRINAGQSLEQVRREVRLPIKLARLPYLAQAYGAVEWAVNGIYRQYTGWYVFNPVGLRPSPKMMRDAAILAACGGYKPLLAATRRALRAGRNQLALELIDVVLSAQPGNAVAREVKVIALQRLAAAASNAVEGVIYLNAAKEAAGGA